MTNAPMPRLSEINRPFYDAGADGKLVLQRCRSCGQWTFFPRIACPHCFADELEWREGSGNGAVYSFALVYRHHHPAFTRVPGVIAAVALAEGPVMISEIVGCHPEEVAIGLEVEVDWEQRHPEIAVPVFRPVARD